MHGLFDLRQFAGEAVVLFLSIDQTLSIGGRAFSQRITVPADVRLLESFDQFGMRAPKHFIELAAERTDGLTQCHRRTRQLGQRRLVVALPR